MVVAAAVLTNRQHLGLALDSVNIFVPADQLVPYICISFEHAGEKLP